MDYTFDGELQCIFGPMFSGKSTELIRRVNRYSLKKRVIVIKPVKDNRVDFFICTHNGARIDAISSETILGAFENVDLNTVDVVAIDEGQFFSDVVEMCEHLANIGKIVIVAALSGSYKRKDFDYPCGRVSSLLSICEKIDKLSAWCGCGKDADFSKRISDEKEDVVTGGKEKYEATCRKCFNSGTQKKTIESV